MDAPKLSLKVKFFKLGSEASKKLVASDTMHSILPHSFHFCRLAHHNHVFDTFHSIPFHFILLLLFDHDDASSIFCR